jgi:hypothetical protein
MRLFFIFLLSVIAMDAFAAEIVRINPSQTLMTVRRDPKERWGNGDFLCACVGEFEYACGFVVESLFDKSLVRLDFRYQELHVGDVVVRGSSQASKQTKPHRKPEGFEEGGLEYYEMLSPIDSIGSYRFHPIIGQRPEFNFTAGVHWSNPMINFQWQTQEEEVALGLNLSQWSFALPFYYFPSESVSGQSYTAAISINYYSKGYFHGMWAQLGIGYLQGNLTYREITGKSWGYRLFSTAGWRWAVGTINCGVGVGLQYFDVTRPGSNSDRWSQISPMTTIDIGFLF